MKNLFYRRLVAIVRVLVVISVLLQQNGARADISTKGVGAITNPSPLASEAEIGFPFKDGQTWYVYQGYNTPYPGTHHGDMKYAFDLVKDDPKDALNTTGGAEIIAIADSTFLSEYNSNGGSWGKGIRTKLFNGYQVTYTHLMNTTKFTYGETIPKGTVLGKVFNGKPGGINHLHINAYNSVSNPHPIPFNFGVWHYPSLLTDPPKWPGEWAGTKIVSTPPCPAPTENQIALYKYPAPNYCGNEGVNAAFFYDASKLYQATTKTSIQVPFTPRAVKFPTKRLDPASGLANDRAYLIRSLFNDSVLTAKSKVVNGIYTYWEAPVVQQPWKSWISQRWLADPLGNNEYELFSLESGFCLSATQAINGGGWLVIQDSCGGNEDKWKLEPIASENGDYRIRHSLTNQILTGLGTTLLYLSNQVIPESQQWHICEVTQIALQANIPNGITIKTNSDDFQPGTTNFLLFLNDKCSMQSADINNAAIVSSFSCNQPPFAPKLQSPLDSYTQENTAPTLRWASGGDPENNPLNYQVEIIGPNENFTSQWVENTVWKPASLDHKFGSYQWRVRARDLDLAISDWSPVRTFTIQSPNKLPAIAFSSANGNTFPSGVIYTRATDWTFTGTANDPEGQLNRVEWHCSGDTCGSQAAHGGAGSWSHTQNGMSGRNDVYFVAYDNYVINNPAGQSAASRHLDLRIDLAAPITTPSLNGQSITAQWPVWFTVPVNINLRAADKGTGNAIVGMVNTSVGSGKIHYRLDNGSWQVVSSIEAKFTVSNDGSHTLEYYSEDALGNTEDSRSLSFQIDQTPPSLPVNLQESHDLVSNQWQKDQNIPAFTWDAATDTISGVRGYQFYFGDDPNGIGYRNILASELRQWIPFPAGLPTGTSYLRARTQDIAGNWSAWATLFTFRYDGTPPENPADVTHTAGITTAWQNTSNTANFVWPAAHDEGSGIKGYYVYWGTQADGTSSDFLSANAFQNLASLCASNAACTGYLRLRSEDNVGNLAEDWNTVFILRYDNAPPVVDFTFNGGTTETTQSQVTLDVTANDEGSGVYAARFSADGQTWTDWEQPAAKRLWNITAISRQSWPVFAQVKDHVGLVSEVMQHEIYLDVNPGQPSSLNFRLFDHGLSAGSGPYASSNYNGRGTLSQAVDSPLASSTHYTLSNGYEAGSQAVPLNVPGHEEYTSLNGIFASGSVATSLQSASYQMILSVGGIGLPPATTINSGHYQHQSGFLAVVQKQQSPDPSDNDQVIMPPPDPEPVLACDAPSISINNGAVYTGSPSVTLSLCAPYATEMMLSAQENFAGAAWQSFASTSAWTISTTGSTVDPHFVYAQFRDANGKVHATYFDDILYDPNQPNGALMLSDDIGSSFTQTGMTAQMASERSRSGLTTTLQAASDGSVTLYVNGYDDSSGMAEMQLSPDPTFASADWQPFSPVVSYIPGAVDGLTTVYARFRDEAGNLSGTTATNFVYDIQPPAGYIYADPAVLPGDASTTTLYLGDYGDWAEYYEGETPPPPSFDGGAVEMRLGSDPDLINIPWQPLAESATIAIDPAQPEGSFYVQYRDAAGNISEVYSTSYQIDTIAPDLSAAAEPGAGNTRTINMYANDELAGIANLYLSNDPLMQQDVITLDYTNILTWTFDDSKVVWIAADDGVGNRTEPYPVYATDIIITISGNVGVAGATLSYTDGSDQTVTSDSDGNYYLFVLSNWSGTITPSKTGYTFSPVSRDYSNVTEDKPNENYTTSLNDYTLTVSSAHGSVTKNPDQATYHEGDVVQLTATPDTGWSFANWTGDVIGTTNPISITIHGNTVVTANYIQNEYTLTITSLNGMVTKNPDQATYHEGDMVQLTATPNTGWSFTNWTGGLTGTANPGSITVHSDTSVTANYTLDNQAPTDLSLSNNIVAENQPAETTVGIFTTTDLDVGNTFTYSLVSGAGSDDNAAFVISDNVLTTAYPLNATLKNNLSIRIRTTDQGGLYFERGFIITVTDLPAIFADVQSTYWANSFIERLYNAGVTGGCSTSPLMYCPDTPVNRAQMAVFLLRGKYGNTYTPPAATGTIFQDVPAVYWAAAWIEQLAAEGITGGCGGGKYCPETKVTRDQMAVFLLRAKYGNTYTPPAAVGIFADVPTSFWAAAWIEALAAEGITGGCGGGNYCPGTVVNRAQIAVFLVKTFNLP